ncbi:hypothetical protein F4802DRAFT_479084 [Xylaria palmicola]|nr:hypothetical protein F4802DRAFT_479084 [Xylaria palmicola]
MASLTIVWASQPLARLQSTACMHTRPTTVVLAIPPSWGAPPKPWRRVSLFQRRPHPDTDQSHGPRCTPKRQHTRHPASSLPGSCGRTEKQSQARGQPGLFAGEDRLPIGAQAAGTMATAGPGAWRSEMRPLLTVLHVGTCRHHALPLAKPSPAASGRGTSAMWVMGCSTTRSSTSRPPG